MNYLNLLTGEKTLIFSIFPFQVRSPFPMIPIGGIQMVHSVPASVTTPLAQQGAQPAASRLLLQKSTSEDSTTSKSPHFTSFTERGVPGGGERLRESTSPHPSAQESKGGGGGVRVEQEESIHTCTKAIASLCIDSEELAERGGGGGGRERGARASSSSFSSPSALSPDSRQRSPPPHPSPSPPQGLGIQHFSGLEVRPPYPSIPTSPGPPSPGSETLPPLAASREKDSTRRSKDAS